VLVKTNIKDWRKFLLSWWHEWKGKDIVGKAQIHAANVVLEYLSLCTKISHLGAKISENFADLSQIFGNDAQLCGAVEDDILCTAAGHKNQIYLTCGHVKKLLELLFDPWTRNVWQAR